MKDFFKKRQIFVLILMELNRKIFDKMAQESISITYFFKLFFILVTWKFEETFELKWKIFWNISAEKLGLSLNLYSLGHFGIVF